MMLLLALFSGAFGADWLTLNNTERGQDEGIRPIAFVQPHVGASTQGAASGLQGGLAAYEGEVPLFNRVYGPGPVGFGLRRARFGVRGTVGHPDVSVFFLLEAGSNGITREAPVALTDATVSWSPHRAFGVRVGQQKLPLMEETLPAVPVAYEWIWFSNTALKLTGENHARNGQFIAPFSAFRDVGAQVFGVAREGQWEASWAAMVGQGRSAGLDVDDHQDLAGRVMLAHVIGESKGPFREEVSVVLWGQTGGRTLDEGDVTRSRAGFAARVELGKLWTLAEGVVADGAVEMGTRPPFPGGAVVVAPEGHGRGGVISAGYRHEVDDIGTFGIKARYDELRLWTDLPEDTRVFRTVTGGLSFDPLPKLGVLLTYEHRVVLAPDAGAAVQGLLGQVGDRVDLQVTARL